MRKIVGLVAVEAAIFGGSRGAEIMWPDISGPAWFALSGCLAIVAAGILYSPELVKFWRGDRLTQGPCSYVPIRNAIRHIIHTTPHSYQNAQLAADHYFKVLHEYICSGRIKAVGRKDEDAKLQRISKRECKKLTPMKIVVPRSPRAPEGVSYCFVARAEPSTYSPLDDATFDGFTDIRVRSRELEKWWPKTEGGDGDA